MKVKTLVLASSNNHKAKEVGMILGRNYQIKTQEEFSVPFVPETGKTFAENAYIKANQLAKNISLPVIADDSGLEVLSINNQPGIYSARYAYIGATDEENINKLLGALKDNPSSERKARFICSLVLIEDYDKQKVSYFNGEWNGEIANKKTGNHGFALQVDYFGFFAFVVFQLFKPASGEYLSVFDGDSFYLTHAIDGVNFAIENE